MVKSKNLDRWKVCKKHYKRFSDILSIHPLPSPHSSICELNDRKGRDELVKCTNPAIYNVIIKFRIVDENI
jgi:ligand-binding sensor protein